MTPEKIIEALVFVSDNPVKPAQVEEIFKGEDFEGMVMTEEAAREILETLVAKYEETDLPWALRRIGGGYQFLTKKDYFPYLKTAVLHKNQRKLSRAAMETLAIIAYRQPVTRTEIEFIRGVNCDYAIQKLLEKNLIEIAGRSDAPGKPLIYRSSPYFFEYFAINDINDLPKLQEITIDEDEYQRQFKTFLEENDDLKKKYGGEPEENFAPAAEQEAQSGELELPLQDNASPDEEGETGFGPNSAEFDEPTLGEPGEDPIIPE